MERACTVYTSLLGLVNIYEEERMVSLKICMVDVMTWTSMGVKIYRADHLGNKMNAEKSEDG